MPKMGKIPVWLVTLTVPKKLMKDITQGSLELESESIDAEDIDQGKEMGIDDQMYKFDDQNDQNGQAGPAPVPGGAI
jgi:hypothetical protein